MFTAFDAEKLYGVDPPEIVTFELCPAKIEIVLWLRSKAPPVLAELTVTFTDAQLPEKTQIFIAEVPLLAFAIKVKMLLFIFACTKLGFEFDAT
jgi:hypothetical protein